MYRSSLLLVCLCSLAVADLPAASRRTAAQILSPKRNDEVGPTCELTGRVQIPGQPIILVRPEFGDRQYWMQPLPELGERGLFRAEIRIGNEQAKAGSRFTVCVVVLRNEEELAFFKGKESLPELPQSLARSEEIPVVLSRARPQQPAATFDVKFVRPLPNAKVKRLDECVGQFSGEGRPVVLVRAEEPNSEWWVQDETLVGKGGFFKATVHFGNDKSPKGMRFRVVVLNPRSDKEAVLFRVGAPIPMLPPAIPRSSEVLVELEDGLVATP